MKLSYNIFFLTYTGLFLNKLSFGIFEKVKNYNVLSKFEAANLCMIKPDIYFLFGKQYGYNIKSRK